MQQLDLRIQVLRKKTNPTPIKLHQDYWIFDLIAKRHFLFDRAREVAWFLFFVRTKEPHYLTFPALINPFFVPFTFQVRAKVLKPGNWKELRT